MTDDKTVVMGLGKNRSLANLQPEPERGVSDHGAGSIHYGLEGCPGLPQGTEGRTSGPVLDTFRAQMA